MPLKFTIIDIHESFYATKSSCFTGCANIFALIRPRGLGQEKNICALDQGSQPIREIREKYFTFFQSGKSQGIW